MPYTTQYNTQHIDWEAVRSLLQLVGMASHSPEQHKQAFENSFAKIFIHDNRRLIGFGRILSDGTYQAAVYDVAIHPDYQGKGIGKQIMEALLAQVPTCNVILYSAIGKEGFYEKEGFRLMKTGMARFVNANLMRDKGFTA